MRRYLALDDRYTNWLNQTRAPFLEVTSTTHGAITPTSP